MEIVAGFALASLSLWMRLLMEEQKKQDETVL